MIKADVQLWGGPQDGLKANVEVGQFSGPPDFVDVPENLRPGSSAVLRPRAEQGLNEMGPTTVRYRLDQNHSGEELMYRLEPKTRMI